MFEEDDFEYRREKLEQMPLYKKAHEIMNIVFRIGKIDSDDITTAGEQEREMIEFSIDEMRSNATIISAKIAGAEAMELYDLKMENAAIIRKAAREIITNARGLEMNGFKETDYLDLLRNEIEEMRILFAEWVKTFDPFNYIIDRWGLFNPPGVNYDDHDPDDDIPFNPDDYFNDL